MSNQEILFHCAPTLANVKVGSLFSMKFDEKEEFMEKIAEKNDFFSHRGLLLVPLRWGDGTCLLYLLRLKKLGTILETPEIQAFLREFTYEDFSISGAIRCLKARLQEGDFPHEIGVFLGYPLEDIRGFILHQGKNCYHTGIWKVYHNPESAIKTFQQYKKCVRIYLERYASGFDMNRLTVVG